MRRGHRLRLQYKIQPGWRNGRKRSKPMQVSGEKQWHSIMEGRAKIENLWNRIGIRGVC